MNQRLAIFPHITTKTRKALLLNIIDSSLISIGSVQIPDEEEKSKKKKGKAFKRSLFEHEKSEKKQATSSQTPGEKKPRAGYKTLIIYVFKFSILM